MILQRKTQNGFGQMSVKNRVKYRLLLIEWESVCELPIGQSCDWHTSPKRELDDVLATAGYMGSGRCVMWTTGHRTPSIKVFEADSWVVDYHYI